MSNNTYIGVDIGGTSMVSGLMIDGEITKNEKVDTLAKESREVILNQLFKVIDAVITTEVKAIGIGCPGFIDTKNSKIVNINNIPALQDVNLKQIVAEKYNLPVYFDNDANCFILGEAYFGAGKGFNHVFGLTLGTGLGGGIVIDKKPYGGLCGGAAEIGCLAYKDATIEDYASSKFFKNIYNTTGYELFQKAETGDKIAIGAFNELGKNIGWVINNILYTMAPEAIIIGGSIVGAFKYIEPGIKEEVDKFLFNVVKENLVIKPAVLDNAGVIGAAALCIADMESI